MHNPIVSNKAEVFQVSQCMRVAALWSLCRTTNEDQCRSLAVAVLEARISLAGMRQGRGKDKALGKWEALGICICMKGQKPSQT